MQVTTPFLVGALDRLIATGGSLDPAATYVGVGTAIQQQGVSTTLANVTEATGAMGTRQAVTTWSAVYQMNDGRAVVDAPVKRFSPASSSEAQTLAVWFLADASTAGNLLAYGIINPGVPLADQTKEWSIVLRVTIDPQGRWSAEVTFNG